MISWKHSLKRLNEEYEITRKKRLALDNLLQNGRISPVTHETFNREIDDAVAEIEWQQRELLEKMTARSKELEEQIKTLERLYATLEIQHVTDEVNEESYETGVGLLSMGLETARQELDSVKQATDQLGTAQVQLANAEAPEAPSPVQEIVENPKPEPETPALDPTTSEGTDASTDQQQLPVNAAQSTDATQTPEAESKSQNSQ